MKRNVCNMEKIQRVGFHCSVQIRAISERGIIVVKHICFDVIYATMVSDRSSNIGTEHSNFAWIWSKLNNCKFLYFRMLLSHICSPSRICDLDPFYFLVHVTSNYFLPSVALYYPQRGRRFPSAAANEYLCMWYCIRLNTNAFIDMFCCFLGGHCTGNKELRNTL